MVVLGEGGRLGQHCDRTGHHGRRRVREEEVRFKENGRTEMAVMREGGMEKVDAQSVKAPTHTRREGTDQVGRSRSRWGWGGRRRRRG